MLREVGCDWNGFGSGGGVDLIRCVALHTSFCRRRKRERVLDLELPGGGYIAIGIRLRRYYRTTILCKSTSFSKGRECMDGWMMVCTTRNRMASPVYGWIGVLCLRLR